MNPQSDPETISSNVEPPNISSNQHAKNEHIPTKSSRKDRIISSLTPFIPALILATALPILCTLIAIQAMEISNNKIGTNILEMILFVAASALLYMKKGSHNFRLGIECTVWLATANMLAFTYLPTDFAFIAAVIAAFVSFILVYLRSTGKPTRTDTV